MVDRQTYGFLNLNKPPKVTSRDVINGLQKQLGKLKLGHAGTLDPMATGVLVVAVGHATRLIQHIQQCSKTYRAEFQLGLTSDTDDIWGHVSPTNQGVEPDAHSVVSALESQKGEILQRPPAVSAVKLGGKRAYQLARAGLHPEIKPRPVFIEEIELHDYSYPKIVLTIRCGSGTYIRSIARDLGERLGTGCVMSELGRLAIGPFGLETALKPEDINSRSLQSQLIDVTAAFPGSDQCVLTDQQLKHLFLGRPIRAAEHAGSEHLVGLYPDGRFAAWLRRTERGDYRAEVNWVPWHETVD